MPVSVKKSYDASHGGHVQTSLTNHHKGGNPGQRPSRSAHTQAYAGDVRQKRKKNSCAGQSPVTFLPYARQAPITKKSQQSQGTGRPVGSSLPRFAEAGSAAGSTDSSSGPDPGNLPPPPPESRRGCWIGNPKICVYVPDDPSRPYVTPTGIGTAMTGELHWGPGFTGCPVARPERPRGFQD